MRIVLDSNVLIAGLMYPHSVPGNIVTAWREAQFDVVSTLQQLKEIGMSVTIDAIGNGVVATTRPYGVDVRAAHDRCAVVCARAHCDAVTDGIDGNAHPELPHPPGDEITTFLVGVGEREAVAAAVIPCPPLVELVEAAHEPRPIDT